LWQANAAPDGAAAILRAASFNLIVLAPSEEDGARAGGVLAEVLAQHPGRVLILCVDPDAAAERLRARVTLHCRAMGGGAQVCGEQVVVVVGGDATERLGGAVGALLLPDCPVIAWWRGGPGPAAPLLDRLVPALDALLLDGTHFEPAALARWVTRVGHPEGAIALGDLAWERGRRWREWTADAFEPPELRPALGALTDVRVAYGAGAEMAGLFYVGWLAARLDWNPEPGLARDEGGGWRGRLGDVGVALRADAGEGELTAVRLAAGGASPLRLDLARVGPERVDLAVTRGDDTVQRRVLRHPEPDTVELVGRWLERPRRDPLYAEALGRLTAMVKSGV
jgi:glucose-6-phosphate dehydrogenase assembly protein OpcA